MPKRVDANRVLIIGAGPIVIGQACEFDYSGSQACRALREEGVHICLLNSNPATIMTDPSMADATYIAPITPQVAERIIIEQKCDALLPTMGGQTALNCAMDLHSRGTLAKHGVKLIGADTRAIRAAEDREEFRKLMGDIGLEVARAAHAGSMEQAEAALAKIGGLPAVIRPSFTLGGAGGGIAYTRDEFAAICTQGLELSPTTSLLIEECLFGWKEFELEVVRDRADNCIVVCGIENVDPLGVHTGDSITVAPIQTLTDKEYQQMRDASFAILRAIGVDTGGANVQFALDPKTGRQLVVEMNPRVSRSSALASKATGFPIAKVSAKLALGYTLDELKNEITGGRTPASFEPSIDYVVVKVPRFDFEKFPTTARRLGTQMRAVGEAMALGRTFPEALQKALRSLESGLTGLDPATSDPDEIRARLAEPSPDSLRLVADALRMDMAADEVCRLTGLDPWFVGEIAWLVEMEQQIKAGGIEALDGDRLRACKRAGFSDARIGTLVECREEKIRNRRRQLQVHPVYKRVDSCAAEFATDTAYMYSTYEQECEATPGSDKKVMILGSGPNRIGQGIEFDYCCIHAALALREAGIETIMVNCNPETVSTDYDISDRLYFEPLTAEDVLEIVRIEKPDGVIVQYGGQTPLSIAGQLADEKVPIIGTPPEAINRSEDRDEFRSLLDKCKLRQPPNAVARSLEQGLELAEQLQLPLVVRPSYVLGGRAMEVVASREALLACLKRQSKEAFAAGILLDKFLAGATEVDVDAICDGDDCRIAGVLEHIEHAGVHSGDSACSLPPHSLAPATITELQRQTEKLALAIGVVGLINVQFAIQGESIYVLEVNPRASRTIPFISKATGFAAARIGALVKVGRKLAQLPEPPPASPWFVKEAVFPFNRMPGADTILGPEMRSTGEVMGIGESFPSAFITATEAAGQSIPKQGMVLFSVRDEDKDKAVQVARKLVGCGFALAATAGTHAAFTKAGLVCELVKKVIEGRPHIVDRIKDGHFAMVINTVGADTRAISDSMSIRIAILQVKVLYFTTIESAMAAAQGIGKAGESPPEPLRPIQHLHNSPD